MNNDTVQVDVRRRYETAATGPGHRRCVPTNTGLKKWTRAFLLCVLWIPVLFTIGLMAEVWFNFNPLGRMFFYVRYVKAVMYVLTWYVLMSTYCPKVVSTVISGCFLFAGIGMVLAEDAVLATIGWSPTWMTVQLGYWGALAVTYLYIIWKVGHGPRHWITRCRSVHA